ncbi:hypothetical protein MSC49_41470 (plasmid) [Methylosinus sp. C49]|jgi:hypothetical protein|uniref:FeoC-like transcriptional regulator n=1 Tax=Methylosinus sp. C49 TaxID=2699395 RepID=UPI001366BFC8|nr:FeoC-like transcriptional regulator [Methylosinus sp. C49]BBU64212.1 hypothetical protein MSC49_41470 [Methylosinus sp. C49]
MLIELADFLASRKEATVSDVAAHFDIAPQTARALLEHWVRKRRAARIDLEQCRQCAIHCGKSWQAYRWIEERADRPDGIATPEWEADEDHGGRHSISKGRKDE